MNRALTRMGAALARFLSRPVHVHTSAPPTPTERLLGCLRPADVLLVEGNSRFSTAIKYLTQSTWSHAALFVGFEALRETGHDPAHCFVEADTVAGVRSIGIGFCADLHSRICRPLGLTDGDRQQVIRHAVQRIGQRYDLQNIFDLARYLLPTPPVPVHWRRGLIELGSGDPTRAICSTLIAQAFQSVRYPILPIVEKHRVERPDCPECIEEILGIRHHSLFTPRDFDVSPYFEIVKPTLDNAFDYTRLRWQYQDANGAGSSLGRATSI